MSQWYIIVNDGNDDYIIPESKVDEWDKLIEEQGWGQIDIPNWAVQKSGSFLRFTDYEV